MIFYDHTSTLHSRLNTGIQRVVRQLGDALSEQARESFVPVIYRQGNFYRFSMGSTLDAYYSHRLRKLAWKLGSGSLRTVRRLCNQNRFLSQAKSSLFAFLEAREDKSGIVRLQGGDWYLTADSIWTHPDILQGLQSLRAAGVRTAIVLYDLIPVTNPEWVDPMNVKRFIPYTAALPSFDVVFCISEFVRQGFLKFCQERSYRIPKKVVTIPMGYTFSQNAKPSNAMMLEGLKEPFVLCVGTLEPRKNHWLLLDAFDILWNRSVDLSLVVVGFPSFGYEKTLERMRIHRLSGQKLFYLSNCNDADLEELYNRCIFTVFPSFTEGFGLPLAESLARGKPCISSDIQVFRDSAGPFGIYCNPQDPFSIATQIENLYFDRERLESLTASIRSQYSPPRWENSARIILDTLRSVEAGPAKA